MNAKRLDYKIDFCNALLDLLEDLKNQGQNLIITGDVNIAHNPIDVYNPANCEGKSGYLIEEREWLDDLLASGFVDTFRMFDDSGDNFYLVELQNPCKRPVMPAGDWIISL